MWALRGIQVVCIDDHADTLEILKLLLETQGATVFTAPSAGEGLSVISMVNPRVVIMDLALPDIDGITLMRQLRRLEAFQAGEMQVIMLSAHCTEKDRRLAIMAGVARFLPKPFDEQQLFSCIQSVIGTSGLAAA
jgi:DNA-binding response OmpR family regulator